MERVASAPDAPLGLRDAGPLDERRSSPDTPQSELLCRPLSIRDIPSMLGDFEFERYQLPESIVAGQGLVRSSLGSLRPFVRGQPRTLVGIDQGKVAAFVQFQPTGRDRRWIALGAGFLSSLYSPDDAVEQLLRYTIQTAGQRGIKRLYARLPAESELADIYGKVGFRDYAAETVWMADRLDLAGPVDTMPLREQEVTDTWAVHQLYNASAPREVQYAEAATSQRWELTHPGRRGSVVRGYLLEEGFQLIGYARVLSCAERHHLEVMFSPDARVDRASFLRSVMGRSQGHAHLRQVYVALRSYQQETEVALESLGFRPRMDQRCTIRYTAARVRQAEAVSLNPLHVEVRERVPKQVPTFLRRRPPGRGPAV